MSEICYLVFSKTGIMSITGVNIELPEQFAGFPTIRVSDDNVQVKLFDEVENDNVRGAMRSYIMSMIERMREYGAPRIEFPCWDLMWIYAVKSENAKEAYWEPEQIIDSFLDLRGPEFMV